MAKRLGTALGRLLHAFVALTSAGAVACAAARAPGAPLPSRERAAPRPLPVPTPAAEAAPIAPAATDDVPEAAPPAPFPPADLAPPFERSAAPGDGQFAPFGEVRPGEPPRIVRTVLHPHPTSRFITVTLAVVDLGRSRLHLVPGTDDLAWAKLPAGPDAGLVPEADRKRLLAVLNGGFQPKHGRWGLVANGVAVSKPREDGCSIVVDADFGVRIGPSSTFGGALAEAPTVRQTPPCLVEHGALHPALAAGDDRAWAGHAADLRTRRRSALGIDASRRLLFYAVGEEAEPRHLAQALLLASASDAAELDINWYWTRFFAFAEESGRRLPAASLIPGMEHLPTEYVERASIRDFFYLTDSRSPSPNRSRTPSADPP